MQKARLIALVAGVSAAIFGIVAASGDAPPRVERVTPSGSAPGAAQIEVRFSAPMIALGDPRIADPASVRCAAGQGRWVDARTWAYDFAQPLAGGLACRVRLRDDLRSAAGAPVQGTREFAFDSGGPLIITSTPADKNEGVEEDQVFLLALNAPPTAQSVAARASCAIEGVGEAVPLDILPTAERDRLIQSGLSENTDWRLRQLLIEAGWRQPDYEGQETSGRKLPLLAVKCRRALPSGGAVSILWGAGIASASGIATPAPRRLDFKVRPAFTASFSCARVNPAAGCSPIEPMRLRFAGRVPRAQAMAVRLSGEGIAAIAPDQPRTNDRLLDEVIFSGPFPERANIRLSLPQGLRDDAGRVLANAERFPLAVRTDEAPPLVKFAGTFGILEAEEGGVLPLTMRNVEGAVAGRVREVRGQALRADASDREVAEWLRRLSDAETRTFIKRPVAGEEEPEEIETTRQSPLIAPRAGARAIVAPVPNGGRSFEVVGVPLGPPGFYVVEMASPRLGAALLGAGKTRYVATGALVTDMAVHFQRGWNTSLAWVTRLSDGRPVAGAAVRVTDSCTGKELWRGTTGADGRAPITADLGDPAGGGSECGSNYGEPPLMVSARADGDFSFTLSNWADGIRPYDFNLAVGYGADGAARVTVFDRTLARAGDTINMKHFLRARTDAGLERDAAAAGKRELRIRHLGSDTVYRLPLAIRADGTGESRWVSPKEAALGDYAVEIGTPGALDGGVSGRFLLDEFRLPTMRAKVSGPAERQVRPKRVPVDLSLSYMSGGAAGGAPVTLRTIVQPRSVNPSGFEDFSFDAEPVKPGIAPADASEAEEAVRPEVIPAMLDANGVARVEAPVLAPIDRPSVLVAEMDYDDPNGERLTASARIPLDPARQKVGIATEGWLAKSDDLRLKFVVLDAADRPIAGRRVIVTLYTRETSSYRKRLIGGFYSYDNTVQTRQIDGGCEVTTDARGRAACALAPGVSGEVIAVAEAPDGAGGVAHATRSAWLAGKDDWWFGGDNGDSMDLIPEAPEYAANATARLQVRMPFRSATALVSVMRDGVMDSFVTEISGKNPVIEVPLKGVYAPNVYVSVLAVRGRVPGWRVWLADLARRWGLPWLSQEAAAPTALIDLSKPAYRLGMAKLKVGWDAHRLAVAVTPDSPRYRPRGQAAMAVKVSAPTGRPLPKDAEVAVAAVDEALLALKPNESWDVLSAMMAERPLSVFTSTAQGQVVGKRHYGRKAVAAGGGGGTEGAPPRRDFEPVLLWRGRVPLGPDGTATVPLKLNDSLSAFRVVAIASAGADLFGTGEAVIRSTQDLILLSGLPPVVRTGDSFTAEVTARNTTAKPMQALIEASAGGRALPPLKADIAPGKAARLAWRLTAPPSPGTATWLVTARAGDAVDKLEVKQAILPAVPERLLQATLLQATGPLSLPVAPPADALPGQGGLEVTLSPSLGQALSGARAWMAAYPYECIEQQASRAVTLSDKARWDTVMAALPRYLDSAGLVRFFPGDWLAGDPALTAYLLVLSDETGWDIPAETRGKMLDALAALVAGKRTAADADVLLVDKRAGVIGAGSVPVHLAGERLMALNALARFARAEPAALGSIGASPESWPTVTVAQWADTLDRLDANTALPAADTALRTRLDSQGTTLALTRTAAPWDLLASPDTTAAWVLLAAVSRPEWTDDAPRLAQGLVARMREGRFDTTVANAMATLALKRFAARFEREAVTGRTRIAAGSAVREASWAGGTPKPVPLAWDGRQTLAVTHAGTGAPWVTVAARAAVPLTKPYASGYTVRRTVTPVTQAERGKWSRGDVMRVAIEVETRADANWTVIDDPVPPGSTILGGGLGGRSAILAGEDAAAAGRAPVWVERRQDSARAFFDYVPRGRLTYEYSVRLGTPGQFRLPPSRVEALYVPGMIALTPVDPVTVE